MINVPLQFSYFNRTSDSSGITMKEELAVKGVVAANN
jgi:hypothetical protein